MALLKPTTIYLSYAPEDQYFADTLRKHLSLLRRSGIEILERRILPGSDSSRERDYNINKANIIILLISADFIASDYSYSIEMKKALERHSRHEAVVIPLLLRPTLSDFSESSPFGNLPVLPSNQKPITQWANRDEAFQDVVREILNIAERLTDSRLASPSIKEITPEDVMASLPEQSRNALNTNNAKLLFNALKRYQQDHENERLILSNNNEFVYYDNIAQVTYVWQIWQRLSDSWAMYDPILYKALFLELFTLLSLSLNVRVSVSITQNNSRFFSFTALDTQHTFINLKIPRKIPLIFCTAPSFDLDRKNELHQLLGKISPSSKLAILLFFIDPRKLSHSQRLLKHFQKAYAYDVIPMTLNEFLKITEASDPEKMFRQWILAQADLSLISPFTLSGPTPERMFFGREQELRTISEHVGTASYAIVGSRRIGKTSIMKRLERVDLPLRGIQASYHDCSSVHNQADLIEIISLNKTCFPEPPSVPFSSLTSLVQALPQDRSIVFLLDETDKIVKPDKEAGYPLLYALRSLANGGNCQFVFAGEFTLLHEMADPQSPLYNFANKLPIGHLEERAARELVLQPLQEMEIELKDESAIVERIITFTAGHPNVIQRLCQRLIININAQQRRYLSIEDIESVIADVDFLRNDFLDTYWGQATLLEHLCTLIMARNQNLRTLVEIHAALNQYLPITLNEVNDALTGLVHLRNLLQYTPQGYIFAVKGFPAAIAQTYELDDLIALTIEKYKKGKQDRYQQSNNTMSIPLAKSIEKKLRQFFPVLFSKR